jgi:hypothetical protein
MVPVDALVRVVAAVRAAGGSLRRRGDVLWVQWGQLDAEERVAIGAVIRRWKPDVLALLDAEAVAAVFPGARLVLCPACGDVRWRRAGDSEVCVRCHPEPARRRRVA